MQTAHQLLAEKANNYIISVSANSKAYNAMKIMAERNIDAVIVMKNGKIFGIFSERDYVKRILLDKLPSKSTTVQEAMTTEVNCVNSDKTLTACMLMMVSLHIKYLLIMNRGAAVGILSLYDLASATIDQQNTTIYHLNKYINSN